MQCYISVDNTPQFRLQVSEGNRHNFKVLNRCQDLNYVTQKKKIVNNICENDNDPSSHFQFYTFRINPELQYTFRFNQPRTSIRISVQSIKNLNTHFGSINPEIQYTLRFHQSRAQIRISVRINPELQYTFRFNQPRTSVHISAQHHIILPLK